MLRLENLNKTFSSNTVALDNFNLEIGAGEFVVILGPSGSGKTTFLRTINGLESLDSGKIYLDGNEITNNTTTDYRKSFGMIFQHFNLVENLTSILNVLSGSLNRLNSFYSLFYYFPRELKLKALECLDRVDLLEKAYEKVENLSGGQKQRVGIARAIMQEPSIILADEPIANLDPMISYDILTLLKNICIKENISIICNLHQVDFALQFADRIVCIAEGKLVIDEAASKLNSETIHQAYQGKNMGMFFEKK
ncbi:phosphonate ABC transporter ATP-binding protein [Spirochaetota bacterium]